MRIAKTSVFVAVVAASLCSSLGVAQTMPAAERPSALKRLNFLEGRWKWAGWVLTGVGRENVEFTSRCEWVSRLMLCRQDQSNAGEWPGIEVYSYNDRKGRYEGMFADGLGQVGAHPLRWDRDRLIAEYEYHVAGAYHLARRTVTPRDARTLESTIEDLADDNIRVVFNLTATRLDK
jgi:hypothetical protein